MGKPNLYSSLQEHFPERFEQIRRLAQQDPGFEEVCSDYEELSSWLASHDHKACPPESACAMNRLLLADLEIEILQYLQAAGLHPGCQA